MTKIFRTRARSAGVGFALGLLAVTPLALGQKMYKCPDEKGGTTFQESPCPETPKEAEARAKEKERLKEEAARKVEEDARKKAEQSAKAKERDKAYEIQLEERAQAARKAQAAEKHILEGTAKEKSDGSLTPEMERQYPGPWLEAAHADINAAFAQAKVQGCEKSRYRQRTGGGSGEFLVQCSTNGTEWVAQYFVWLATGTVRGPFKL
jgi:hypothetical protein